MRGRLPTSAWLLLAANLVPLVGVLALGWRLPDILLLFWTESAIIGGFTILKMLSKRAWSALFYVPFFCVHYGLFMSVHLLFLVSLFLDDGPFATPGADVGATLRAVAWGALALTASHGASFVLHWLRGHEREKLDMKDVMGLPYPRIVVMHLTIIFGAMLAVTLGSPVYALVLLLALKTAVDLQAHLRERRRAARHATPDATDARLHETGDA